MFLYESGEYYVIATAKAYEVYKNVSTHAERCATIGLSLGLGRAIREVERRLASTKAMQVKE